MIGEIGLDFHWVRDASQYPAQKRVFEYFLAAAKEQRKIVNLHTKGAEKEVLDLLEHYGLHRAIVHWYSGPMDILRAMIAAGIYFTIGVEVLFSESIREIAELVPIERILTETDNPGGLKWLNGSPGMPKAIEKIVQVVAEIKGVDSLSFAASVASNWNRLIRGDPWLDGVRSFDGSLRALRGTIIMFDLLRHRSRGSSLGSIVFVCLLWGCTASQTREEIIGETTIPIPGGMERVEGGEN